MKPSESSHESTNTLKRQEVDGTNRNGLLLDEIQILKDEVRALRREFKGVKSRIDNFAGDLAHQNSRFETGKSETKREACNRGSKTRKKKKTSRDDARPMINWGAVCKGNPLAWTATFLATLSCAALFFTLTSGHEDFAAESLRGQGEGLRESEAVGTSVRNIQVSGDNSEELFYPDFADGSCVRNSDGLIVQGDNDDGSNNSFQTVEECCQIWYLNSVEECLLRSTSFLLDPSPTPSLVLEDDTRILASSLLPSFGSSSSRNGALTQFPSIGPANQPPSSFDQAASNNDTDALVSVSSSPSPSPDSTSIFDACFGVNPEQCGCRSTYQSDYRGIINTTRGGQSCVHWESANYSSVLYPDFGLDENYCRNPGSSHLLAW